jgi:hypothetical protein
VLPALFLCLAACANTARFKERAGNHIQVGTAYLSSVQYTLALKEFLAPESEFGRKAKESIKNPIP